MPSAQKYDWLVTLPDNDGMLQTRIANRPRHLAHNKPHFEDNTITFGGPMYSSPATSMEDGMTKINGSVHLVRAETEEKVWELVRDDPYATLGVWDLGKAKVTPMKCFVMQPMTV